MLGVLEIGNTNVVFAVMEGAAILKQWRLASDRARTADEYGIQLSGLLSGARIAVADLGGIAVASVIPTLGETLGRAARQHIGADVIHITTTADFGIHNLCEPADSVGVDRLLNASAAFHLFGGPAIVVDLGTATTFDVVSADGEFLGGAIAPGLRTAADALTANAPRLGSAALEPPPAAVGRNTNHALRSGIVLGYASMVDGMVARIRAEVGKDAICIATGGLAGTVAPVCASIDRLEPDITLAGVRLACERLRLLNL